MRAQPILVESQSKKYTLGSRIRRRTLELACIPVPSEELSGDAMSSDGEGELESTLESEDISKIVY